MPLNDADSPFFHMEWVVAEEVIDRNLHVNNVAYVKWMQDVAITHSKACIGPDAVRANGYTWVARSHHIEYLKPAVLGDVIDISTWLTSIRRVRCQRKYEFRRLADDQLIARGETDWVFVDAESGRPASIPDSIRTAFPIVPAEGDTSTTK